MYAAAAGDLDNLRRYAVHILHGFLVNTFKSRILDEAIISCLTFRHMFLGHDMSVSDFDGRTPLHLAAAEGHLECVKFLLQSSCEVPVEPTDRYSGHGIQMFIILSNNKIFRLMLMPSFIQNDL